MALEAKLNIGGGPEYDVIKCEYELSQQVKDNHLPAGHPEGGVIKITMLSQDNANLVFHEWMADKTLHKNGSVVFAAVKDAKTSEKLLSFENAYCIKLHECFDKHSDNEMVMCITISASIVKFGAGGNVKFTNDYIA